MSRGLLVLLSMLVLTAPVAVAQEDEVFVDPGSPSGKEYALPVDSARRQASGQQQKAGTASQPAPLFGEGVEPEAAATSSSGGASSSGSGGGTQSKRKAGKARRAAGATPRPSRSGEGASAGVGAGAGAAGSATLRAQAASPDGGSGLALIIGAGAGVLLLGGALGLLLRRRATRAA